jgi:hypothetical protein
MKRLARLLPFRQFGRFHHLRMLRECGAVGTTSWSLAPSGVGPDSSFELDPCIELPQANRPAFARLPLRAPLHRQPSAPAQAPASDIPATDAAGHGATQKKIDASLAGGEPVRVYRGPSRVTLVGHIDAVCRMLDRCIAEENAGLAGGLFDCPA